MGYNIIVIPDIHGRDTWKSINAECYDKIIFIGDYFDSFHIDVNTQITNFENIIEFKKNHNDKVILLIGNHDYHYFSKTNRTYSGFNVKNSNYIRSIILESIELFDLCHYENINNKNYIFSHAGISNTFSSNFSLTNLNSEDLVNTFNLLFKKSSELFEFGALSKFKYKLDMYGDDTIQSPLWIRPDSLNFDPLYLSHNNIKNLTQVVGHTHFKKITTVFDTIDTGFKFIFTDCHDTNDTEFLVIDESNNIIIKQLK